MRILWNIVLSGLIVFGVLLSFLYVAYLVSKEEQNEMEGKRAQIQG